MDKRPKYKIGYYKTPEENIGKTLSDIFLDPSSTVMGSLVAQVVKNPSAMQEIHV